MLIELLIFKS